MSAYVRYTARAELAVLLEIVRPALARDASQLQLQAIGRRRWSVLPTYHHTLIHCANESLPQREHHVVVPSGAVRAEDTHCICALLFPLVAPFPRLPPPAQRVG